MILSPALFARLLHAHLAGEAKLGQMMRLHAPSSIDTQDFLARHTPPKPSQRAVQLAQLYAKRGFSPLTWLDATYPKRIRHLLGDASPPVLYFQGNLQLLDRLSVSLIGMRRPTPLGRACATSYAQALAQLHCPVVSGNAPGIDAASHNAALRAQGATIVFPPSCLELFQPAFSYPAPPDKLLVLSPFAPGIAAEPWCFLRRNQLVASHACAAIIAETGARGGTLNTVSHLRSLQRPWFVSDLPQASPHYWVHQSLLGSGGEAIPPQCNDATLRHILARARKSLGTPFETHQDLFSQEETE